MKNNFTIFSQATGQTWHHTSAYHLSALGYFIFYQHTKIRKHKKLHVTEAM